MKETGEGTVTLHDLWGLMLTAVPSEWGGGLDGGWEWVVAVTVRKRLQAD